MSVKVKINAQHHVDENMLATIRQERADAEARRNAQQFEHNCTQVEYYIESVVDRYRQAKKVLELEAQKLEAMQKHMEVDGEGKDKTFSVDDVWDFCDNVSKDPKLSAFYLSYERPEVKEEI